MSKLRLEDAQALDLLLDRTTSLNGNGDAVAFGGTAPNDRVRGVQQVLRLLDMMQPEEPPMDLVSRTLRRVNDAVAEPRIPDPTPRYFDNRPHA